MTMTMMMIMTVMSDGVVVDVDVGAVDSLHCLLLSLFGRRAHNRERVVTVYMSISIKKLKKWMEDG